MNKSGLLQYLSCLYAPYQYRVRQASIVRELIRIGSKRIITKSISISYPKVGLHHLDKHLIHRYQRCHR